MELPVWSIALLALGLGTAVNGCRSSASSFECSSADDCGGDGRCEATGFCSFPDPGCASGFRYSDFAESLSNQCVMDEAGSTGLPMLPGTSSTQAGPTGSTSTSGTTTTSSGSSDTSTSVGTTDGSTSSTGSSSDSGSDTTGSPSDCLLEEFDELPGLPLWFSFADNAPSISVEDGQLVLEVQSPTAPSTAGLRTNIPGDFSTGSARALLTELPSLAVATTAFSLNDEVFESIDGRTFGTLDGMIRLEQTIAGVPTLLANEPIGQSGFPLELAFVVDEGGDLTFVVTRGEAAPTQLYSEPAPDWLDDAYVSMDAGNPSNNSTNGITRFDRIELCADGLK